MKTPEQIAEEIYTEYENARDNIILTPEGYRLDLVRAIEADRAQRPTISHDEAQELHMIIGAYRHAFGAMHEPNSDTMRDFTRALEIAALIVSDTDEEE